MLSNWKADHWAITICVTTGVLLCVALIMEYALGLSPCPLCMMQRIWVALTGLIAYASLAHNPRWGIYPLLGGISAMVGGGFSIRQLWLQNLPNDQVPACAPDLSYMLEAFPIADVLAAMMSGTGDCAEISWTFLGISLPGWLLLFFGALLAMNIMQIRQGSRA